MRSATRPDTRSSLSPATARRSARALTTLLAAALSIAGTAAAIAQQSFDVAMRDGLLSIRANGTPATALAAALAEETGVRFVITGDAEQAITAEIVDEPLIKAIALLSPNHLLVRGDAGANAPVVEVVLMMDDARDGTNVASGGVNEAEFLPSGEPADQVYSDDETYTDETYTDDAYIDDPYTDDAYIDDPYTDDAYIDDPYADDPYADDAYIDELPPEGQLGPDGQPLVQ